MVASKFSTWSRGTVGAVVVAAWSAFAAWQYAGFRHERAIIRDALYQQTGALMHALIGGAGSHRRRGQFYEDQLQGMLNELVAAGDVLAAAIRSGDGSIMAGAGEEDLLGDSAADAENAAWEPAGFRLVEQFELAPPEAPGLGGPGRRYGRGQGPRARMMQQLADEQAEAGEPVQYTAALLVDRTRADALVQHAAQSHTLVALAGAAVLALAAWAWRAAVATAAAQGEAQLLQKETRFLRNFSQAAAGLAHETRNPLGLIRGWTQRLAQTESDPQRQEQAHAVVEECDRLTARINQFLAFAKPPEVRLAATPLAPLLDELKLLLEPDLDDKQLQVECAIGPECTTLQADRELLRQALFNLLQNAVHFSPPGGTIAIKASAAPGGDCQIAVNDRGPGVPAEQAPSLFTPYFTTRSEGTGLGLAIVQQIAQAHGWQAEYADRSGGGASFALTGIHAESHD